MRVYLVTGAAGFIGSNYVHFLRREAPDVGFARGLADTVAWYSGHRAWWEDILDRKGDPQIDWPDAPAAVPAR